MLRCPAGATWNLETWLLFLLDFIRNLVGFALIGANRFKVATNGLAVAERNRLVLKDGFRDFLIFRVVPPACERSSIAETGQKKCRPSKGSNLLCRKQVALSTIQGPLWAS